MIKAKFNLKKITGIFFILQIIFALALLSLPTSSVLAADASTKPLQFIPQVSIPNSSFTQNASTTVDGSLLARYILTYYNYGLAIVGILATIILMGAGVLWLTSGGDSGKVTQAKDLISGSITGIAILICAWIILNTVNPNLTQLASISPVAIGKVDMSYLICCDSTSGEIKTPVQIVGGKYISIDGTLKGQEIKCGNNAPTCGASELCVKNNSTLKYVCKSGGCGEPGSICVDKTCNTVASAYYDGEGMIFAKSFPFSCTTGQKCCNPYKKVGESCGNPDKNAKCYTGSSSCPSGYTEEDSGTYPPGPNKESLCPTSLMCCKAG